MSGMLSDLLHALRGLLARPAYTFVAVATLALGVGANVAALSLFRQVLSQALPVAEPSRLVNLEVVGREGLRLSTTIAGGMETVFSWPQFLALEKASEGKARLAAHRMVPVHLAAAGRSESVQAMLVSGAYFATLGVRPALGRAIGPQDTQAPGQARVAVLDHAYWRDAFAADPDVVGQALRINGRVLDIVGVAPAGFSGTTPGIAPKVYLPITWPAAQGGLVPDHASRTMHWLYLFARPGQGVDVDDLRQRLDAVYRAEIALEAPPDAARQHLVFAPGGRGQGTLAAEARQPLIWVQWVAGLVLAMACVNLANLQLARGVGQGSQMAVRAAIGASRRRLLRQALAEPVCLVFAGAVVSWPVAWGLLRLLSGVLPLQDMPLALDAGAALTGLAVAFLALAGFGLYPAWRLAGSAPMGAIKAQSAQGGRAATRMRAVLVAVQVAFSMALLGLAGLFVQSLVNLERHDLGIATDTLLVFGVEPGRNGYDAVRAGALFDRIESELAALPGARAVSRSAIRLLDGSIMGAPARAGEAGEERMTRYNAIGPGFLATVGAPLLAGREFDAADRAGAPKVALVDRRFAQAFGLGEAPIGQQVRLAGEGTVEIVGVVGDMAYQSARDEPMPQMFLPEAQGGFTGGMNFYLRSELPPMQLQAPVQRILAEIDPDLPVLELRSMREQLHASIEAERTVGVLAATLAGLATVLAAGGLYSVLSYLVAQRTRELGLRLALGAAPGRLRRWVMGRVLWLGVLGGGIGLLVVLAVGRAAEAWLFGLNGHDPRVLVPAALVLALVVGMAGFWPARRAARVDPLTALRADV